MASCFEYCNIKTDPKQLKELADRAKCWSLTHGLLIRNSETDPEKFQHAPFTLFPSVFPSRVFQETKSIQCVCNTLMHKVAHDHQFLKKALESVIRVDAFTRRQWEIYETVRKEGVKQPICLGLFRNDYMLNMKSKQANSLSLNDTELKQIEFNMMAAGAGGLATETTHLHRYVMDLVEADYSQQQIPENHSSREFAEAIAKAWKMYGNERAVILYLAYDNDINIIDQQWIKVNLYQVNKKIKIIRRKLSEVYEEGELTDKKELIIDGQEVAVAYFRLGYSPKDFPSHKEWDGLLKLARCRAIKCPTIQYQLANTKKIQQELTKPGAVEKYISDERDIAKIRQTFAKQYSLEENINGVRAIDVATKDPEKYVLKPQREGGGTPKYGSFEALGNNLYGRDMQILLEKIRNTDERAAYILMERIYPLPQKNYMVRAGSESQLQTVISELGFYSVYIGTETEEKENYECGYLLRTKIEGMNEGGIMTGDACIDSPLLMS